MPSINYSFIAGQRYDIRIMLDILIPFLTKEYNDEIHIIKRGSGYSAITTENLKFLDITNFLAAGTCYSDFLKAYNAPSNKSYFPYESFNSLDQLDGRVFPPYEAFYSRLKNTNTLLPLKTETITLTQTEQQTIGNIIINNLTI